MERVQDVLNYKSDVWSDREQGGAKPYEGLYKLSGAIDVKDLTFGYSRLEKPTVEGLDLHVEPGQWVALVGGSGSGKSTIAKLISGLYKTWSSRSSPSCVSLKRMRANAEGSHSRVRFLGANELLRQIPQVLKCNNKLLHWR